MSYHGLGQTATCLTAAQHATAVAQCNAKSIKGIGSLGATIRSVGATAADPCALAKLPICTTFMTLTSTTDGGGTTPGGGAPPSSNRGLVVGSVLLLVVGGGGYLLWRGTKKRGKRR